jgi:hypothetical protein
MNISLERLDEARAIRRQIDSLGQLEETPSIRGRIDSLEKRFASIVGTSPSNFLTTAALAKDLSLPILPRFNNLYDLNNYSGKSSYYDLMKSTIEPKIADIAKDATQDNVGALKAGKGVAVKLGDHNYNIHVNFPLGTQGGRSYGWTSGQVGDWSDLKYLQHLAQVVLANNPPDLSAFYETIVRILGACNPQGIENLIPATQRVATNFLAIYTAEQYRAMVPKGIKNWDDALLQVTMLGAFHGGQSKFTMFYEGKFTVQTKKQAAGVYTPFGPGPTAKDASDKPAGMDDYWQFSRDPDSNRSGVNETRGDFEKMGHAITKYEASIQSQALAQVQAVVGKSDNVIETTSKFFTTGQSKDMSKIDDLAKAVSTLMLEARGNADEITTWQLNRENRRSQTESFSTR